MRTDSSLTEISRAHAHYALGILTLTYVFNFLHRQLLSVLVEPMKEEFQASDTQMGILYGLVFAVFYVTLSIPAAMWADRGVRRNVLAWAAGVWSLMTVLCAVAGNYWHLLLFRIGVGIGQAGGTPPSQSLVADYYPPKDRSTAMSIFACGTFIGMMLAFGGGGWIAENYGWRRAFLVLGAPGLVLALLIRFTLREPAKGYWDEQTTTADDEQQGAFRTFREMWNIPAMRALLLGAGFASLAGYGLGHWQVSFLIRVHEMSLFHASIVVGLLGTVSALAGSLLGGLLCDRMVMRDRAWQMLVPMLSLILSLPLLLLFLLWPEGQNLFFGQFQLPVAALFAILSGVVGTWWAAPSYVAAQALVAPTQRTLACAILMLFMSLIGLSLGPFLVGWVSDLTHPVFGKNSIRWGLAAAFFSYLVGIFFYYRGSRHYHENCWDRRHLDTAPAATATASPAATTPGARSD